MTFVLAQRLDRRGLSRMLVAGSAWGWMLAAAFFALNAPQCGLPCPDDAAVTTAVCVGTGILTIGSLAAFAGRY